jgi:hypothetical protein
MLDPGHKQASGIVVKTVLGLVYSSRGVPLALLFPSMHNECSTFLNGIHGYKMLVTERQPIDALTAKLASMANCI